MDGSYEHDRDRHKHQSAVLAVFAETWERHNYEGRESWLPFFPPTTWTVSGAGPCWAKCLFVTIDIF